MILNSVLVLLLLSLQSGDSKDFTGSRVTGSLKFVVVASRHGNRGASKDYPWDPYPLNNSHFWPYGADMLTPHGRVQAYSLGVKLRSLYGGFLSPYFFPMDIYATSDYVDRVILTGECVLAGLYPPVGFQVWNPNINWQPVPLYTNSSDHSEDIDSCPKRFVDMKAPYNQFLIEDAKIISAMIQYVHEVTGAKVTVQTLYDMYLKLNSEEFEGYALPEWAKNLYPQPLTDFYNQLFVINYAPTEEVIRLSVGKLLDEIIQAMQDKVDGSKYPDRKVYFNSGHDNTILCLEIALGIRRSALTLPVEVGSALLVELHQDSKTREYYVQVLYINSRSQGLVPSYISLPDCGNPCYFQTLVKNTQPFRKPINYSEECNGE